MEKNKWKLIEDRENGILLDLQNGIKIPMNNIASFCYEINQKEIIKSFVSIYNITLYVCYKRDCFSFNENFIEKNEYVKNNKDAIVIPIQKVEKIYFFQKNDEILKKLKQKIYTFSRKLLDKIINKKNLV